jgi:phenylalanine-4-hydroxylase
MTLTGKFKGINELPFLVKAEHLSAMGLTKGKVCKIEMENGSVVEGVFSAAQFNDGKLLLLNFNESEVRHPDGLFESRHFDFFSLAPATKIVSVFNGAADKSVFADELYVSRERTGKANYSESDLRYQDAFRKIREIREETGALHRLESILKDVEENFPDDWLCLLEIAELTHSRPDLEAMNRKVRKKLEALSEINSGFTKLIRDGLAIVDQGLIFE